MALNLRFEWDSEKARSNRKKHGVSFEEASTVFGDPHSMTIPDPLHSIYEDRFVIIGLSYRLRTVVVVVHTENGNAVRIISAREASRHEKAIYEEG